MTVGRADERGAADVPLVLRGIATCERSRVLQRRSTLLKIEAMTLLMAADVLREAPVPAPEPSLLGRVHRAP